MPKKTRFNLPPLNLGKESLGPRIARLRKERGLTQVQLANEIGIIQSIISGYEQERLRPTIEMLVRLAQVLKVTTDELLGVKSINKSAQKASLKIIRRLQKIQKLPPAKQKAVLKTIDMLLEPGGK